MFSFQTNELHEKATMATSHVTHCLLLVKRPDTDDIPLNGLVSKVNLILLYLKFVLSTYSLG